MAAHFLGNTIYRETVISFRKFTLLNGERARESKLFIFSLDSKDLETL